MGEAEGGCGFRYRANILDKQIKSASIYSVGLRVNISVYTGYDSIIMVRKQGFEVYNNVEYTRTYINQTILCQFYVQISDFV